MDGQMDGWTNGRTDGWADRPTLFIESRLGWCFQQRSARSGSTTTMNPTDVAPLEFVQGAICAFLHYTTRTRVKRP